MTVLERVGWAVAMPILTGVAFLTPRLGESPRSSRLSRVATPAASAAAIEDVEGADPPRVRSQDSDAFVDLYGNDVKDAIATYTVDQSGSLYELHSPQTEIPNLGIPQS